MKFSLIISTLGRHVEVLDFVRTIEAQTFRDFEVIIVDQNDDDALARAVQSLSPSFPLRYKHVPGVRGLSRGRNLGFEDACGELICFPDDDCVYPARLLQDVLALFSEKQVDIVCGRAADENGRDINGRFEAEAQAISTANVFSTQIEWVVFFTRAAFERVNGYDVDIGVGASTPWQANEGQDIVLRMLEHGYRGWYDPRIFGHHPELNVVHPDERMRKKARGYARGMGYVLGRHSYPLGFVVRYVVRSIGGVVLSLLRLNGARAAYYLQVTAGRIEGYLGGRRTAGRLPSVNTGLTP
ncbi:MAG: glycosyltransferase [Rhizobium sp.]|nr:glycosyltransferase [Rhizobium sp.]